MKKIVITGGLGYIGTELCRLYSGEARYKNIVVVDKDFSASKVKQLRRWGMNFKRCSILDKECIAEIVKDADTVIHLAGITDVAYTKTESMPEKDQLIKETGIVGTRNIIESISDNCKIIFPSTHVVFEGFNETKLGIHESENPCPVLSYAKGKAVSECDLASSGKSYVILRLASVYGYSDNDKMRINIMPNLFASKASQKDTIKLFSGGVQMKSLVPVLDVARCMKFMEGGDIDKEIFHVSLESMSVKDVAYICKEFVPDLNIVETDDEIPNLGYTISNAKLLETGFQFRYNIKECIKEMIENWSKQSINSALEYVDKGGKEYSDQRGRILNYELTEPINLIGLITSKKGTVRANHYHPIQEQKCLLMSGGYISVIKDLSCDGPIETKVIKPGDIAIIKPNVAHTMVFTRDSIFLNLVNGEREHENYGITHTIPYELVTPKMRDDLLANYNSRCISCLNDNLQRVVSFGYMPLANNLIDSTDGDVDTYPLEMNYCPDCSNCQLSYSVPPNKMFDHYLYLSSTSKKFVEHFEKAAKQYIQEFNLDEDSFVIDIGSNDGIALKPFKECGIKVLGVEPATNVAQIAINNGIPTVNSYLNKQTVEDIREENGLADLILASNVFAHSDDLSGLLIYISRLLSHSGTIIIEVQYLLSTLQDLTFDNIYHEHYNYWSVTALEDFVSLFGMTLYKVEYVDTHGGSIRAYIKLHSIVDESVQKFLDNEKECGLLDFSTYEQFGRKIYKIRENVRKNIEKLRTKYGKIAGYGAPAKATTALNFFDINLDYIIEDNYLKFDKIVPGVNIPIKNKEYAMNNLPDLVIVLAWNFYDSIVENNQQLIDSGVKFINIKDLYTEND